MFLYFSSFSHKTKNIFSVKFVEKKIILQQLLRKMFQIKLQTIFKLADFSGEVENEKKKKNLTTLSPADGGYMDNVV